MFSARKTYVSALENLRFPVRKRKGIRERLVFTGLRFFQPVGRGEDNLSHEYPFRVIICFVYPMYLLHLLRRVKKIMSV